jgi:hypothetical protein
MHDFNRKSSDLIESVSSLFVGRSNGETVRLIKKNPKRRINMVAYEFYFDDGREEISLIGILPERRKNKRRVNRKSIMKWGKLAAGSYVDPNSIYYIQVESQKEL